MYSSTAFLAPSPLSRCSASGRRAYVVPRCCDTRPPTPSWRPQLRPLPAVTGAVAGALALVFLPFNCPASAAQQQKPAATSKELRYDGRQELDSGEKAMSLTLTAGTFAALGVWAWKQNRRDDELEEVRIKDEVERLEKLRAEFFGVEEDDESMDDEDLLASLKQRIEDTEEGSDDGSGATGVLTDDDTSAGADDEQKGQSKESPTDAASPDAASPDSLDMLKRMWEATDDDQKKKEDKS